MIELKMLLFTTLLGVLQLLLATSVATLKYGVVWNLSNRDTSVPPLTGVAGRIDRASKNFQQTYAFFLAAVLALILLHKESSQSALGCELFFYARLAYFPVYAAGIVGLRTFLWLVSLTGLGLLIFASFAT